MPTLTTAQQTIRTNGMSVFAARKVGLQIEQILTNVYLSLRGRVADWKSRLTGATTMERYALGLELRTFAKNLTAPGASAYSRLKSTDAALIAAGEQSLGYPDGFTAVAILILDDLLDDLATISDSVTSTQLTTILNRIESELSAIPTV